MSYPLRHARALWRCTRRALPVVWYANARCRELTAAFEASVMPMIAANADEGRHRYLHDQLLSWGIKSGYAIENYARLTGSTPRPEVSILAGVFTRLYDDVLDEFDDDTVGERLAVLFAGGDFAARGAVERLLEAVYRRLEELVPRAGNPTAYRALAELHRCQVESVKQAGSVLSGRELWDLSLAKGGWAMVVLCSLVNPHMSPLDEALAYDVGALLQVVDDYQDAPEDRRDGLRTTATEGAVAVGFLLGWLGEVEARARRAYGAKRCPVFFDSAYLWLYTIVVIRFLRSGPVRRGAGPVPRLIPMRVILLRREAIR